MSQGAGQHANLLIYLSFNNHGGKYVPPNSKLRVPLHAYSAEACGRKVVSEYNRVYALISSFQHTIVGAFLTPQPAHPSQEWTSVPNTWQNAHLLSHIAMVFKIDIPHGSKWTSIPSFTIVDQLSMIRFKLKQSKNSLSFWSFQAWNYHIRCKCTSAASCSQRPWISTLPTIPVEAKPQELKGGSGWGQSTARKEGKTLQVFFVWGISDDH